MKKYYNRWKKLVWYERILAIPGILVMSALFVIVSPIMLLMYVGMLTFEIFGNGYDL